MSRHVAWQIELQCQLNEILTGSGEPLDLVVIR